MPTDCITNIVEKLNEFDSKSATGAMVSVSSLRQSCGVTWRNENLCRATLDASLAKLHSLTAIGKVLKFDRLLEDVNEHILNPQSRSTALSRLAETIEQLPPSARLSRFTTVRTCMRIPPVGPSLTLEQARSLVNLARVAHTLGPANDAVHDQFEQYLPAMPMEQQLDLISALVDEKNHFATQPRRYRLLEYVEQIRSSDEHYANVRKRIQSETLPNLMRGLTTPENSEAIPRCLADLERFPAALSGQGLANIIQKIAPHVSREQLHTIYAGKLSALDEDGVADFIEHCGHIDEVLETGGIMPAAGSLSPRKRAAALETIASCYPTSDILQDLRPEIFAHIAALPEQLRGKPLTSFAKSQAKLSAELNDVIALAATVPEADRSPIIEVLLQDLKDMKGAGQEAYADLYEALIQNDFFTSLAMHTKKTQHAMLTNVGGTIMHIDSALDGSIVLTRFSAAVNRLPINERPSILLNMAENIELDQTFGDGVRAIYDLADQLSASERTIIGEKLATTLRHAPYQVVDHIMDESSICEDLKDYQPELQAPLVTVLAGHLMHSVDYSSHIDDACEVVAGLPPAQRVKPLIAMAENLYGPLSFRSDCEHILSSAVGLSPSQMLPIYEHMFSNIPHAAHSLRNLEYLMGLTAEYSPAHRTKLCFALLDGYKRCDRIAHRGDQRAIYRILLEKAKSFPQDQLTRVFTQMLDSIPPHGTDELRREIEASMTDSWFA